MERLVGQAYEVVQGRNDIAPEQVLSGALTVMIAAYGRETAAQVQTLRKRCDDIASEQKGSIGRAAVGRAVHGALQNLCEEVAAGLLTSIEHQVASDVLSDLLRLARLALEETSDGAKNVAAVLAAAAYEDTIRRIAKEHAYKPALSGRLYVLQDGR